MHPQIHSLSTYRVAYTTIGTGLFGDETRTNHLTG
jgi:hypothetical protein